MTIIAETDNAEKSNQREIQVKSKETKSYKKNNKANNKNQKQQIS